MTDLVAGTAAREPVTPEEAGLDRRQLARVDEHLRRRYLEPGKIAGALTLVARGDRVAYLSPIGLRDRERHLPVEEETIFRIYSMTKPIASVALMMLYERGAFQLGDAVTKFIPEWRDLGVYVSGSYPDFATRPPERSMTICDLLTHTSGLTYDFMELTEVDAAYRQVGIGRNRQGETLETTVEKLAYLPLEFSPGARWNYSVSTDVVGLLVQRLSGKPLDVFLEEEIFEPLGMVDTGFHVPADKVERFAANYDRTPDKRLRLFDDPQTSPYLQPPTYLSGGGGLVSTAGDYLRFCRMLLGGGRLGSARILGRKTLELMTRNHLPSGSDLAQLATGSFSETTYDGVGFGLGFGILLDPVEAQVVGSAGEYFWGGMASTTFWIDPSEELIVIFMTQFMPSGTFNFRGQLKSLIYAALD